MSWSINPATDISYLPENTVKRYMNIYDIYMININLFDYKPTWLSTGAHPVPKHKVIIEWGFHFVATDITDQWSASSYLFARQCWVALNRKGIWLLTSGSYMFLLAFSLNYSTSFELCRPCLKVLEHVLTQHYHTETAAFPGVPSQPVTRIWPMLQVWRRSGKPWAPAWIVSIGIMWQLQSYTHTIAYIVYACRVLANYTHII